MTVFEVRKSYLYPAHADRVFAEIVREQKAQGRALSAVSKGYLLGTGVSLRLAFTEQSSESDYRMAHFWGRRRDISDPAFQGWRVFAVLPMKLYWITIGYFYVLAEDRAADAG